MSQQLSTQVRKSSLSSSFILLEICLAFCLSIPHGFAETTPNTEPAAATTAPPTVPIDPEDRRPIEAPCAVIEGVLGEVQILDEHRTRVIDAAMRSPVACGSWVSVNRGWAEVRHQSGPHLKLGAKTLIQFPDFSKKDSTGDQAILYQGQVFTQAGDGEEEFLIVSASGRARVRNGKFIMVFNSDSDETQLIALENAATLENRFEPASRVKIHAGEATSLNFQLKRVIPLLPQAVSIASIRPKLSDLRIEARDQSDAIKVVLQRQNRKFASRLVDEKDAATTLDGVARPHHVSGANRKLASDSNPAVSYLRHPPGKDDAHLRNYWVKKMVGGEDVGEKILYPDKYYGKSQKVRVEVIDPAEKFNLKQQKQEALEKKRLIDELSQIHLE